MNKIIRYYNQNRLEIILVIIAIILGIFLLRFINYNIAKRKEKENVENISDVIQENEKESKSIITGEEAKVNTSNNKELIQNFIKYCNGGETEKAYDLLTDDCKEELYPKLEDFEKVYYNSKFVTNKTCEIENWNGATYRIRLSENALETGKISTEKIEDYVTIRNQDGESRLNINGYIGRTKLNNKNEKEDIKIEITEKNTYMDYEIYTIKVKNNNDEDILLDDLKNTDTIYISDENGTKHVAYMHELLSEQLRISKKTSKELRIKFTNAYISNRKMKKITFSNIMINNGSTVSISIDV
jgi:predicted metal-dependent hydrolase